MRRVFAILLLGGALGCASARDPVSRALEGHAAELAGSRKIGGEVWLRCAQAEAEVVLDGVPVGRCEQFSGNPAGLALDGSAHALEVRKPGFSPFRSQLEAGGARTSLTVDLTPLD